VRATASTLAFVLAACNGTSPAATGSTSTTGATSTTSPAASTVLPDSTGAVTTAETGAEATSTAPTTSAADTSTTSDDATTTGAVEPCSGELPTAWPDGTDCSVDDIAVHRYADDTFILRQSLCTSFEGPFLYLLFGSERALLLDTGDGGIDLANVVGGLIEQWLAARGQASIELVVVNTHAHGDHTAGNPMFEGLPGVTVVPPSVSALSAFFGIDDWPDATAIYDLGDRAIDVVPIPGHQASHIALFDHGSGWLLTGDTLYPGRLYIDDFPAYVDSIGRLVDHVAGYEVCNVMGTHVEMTDVPGVDFDFGADEHPGEHALPLDLAHLVELRDAVEAMAVPAIEIHDDFIIYPLSTR
jgi:glyoxylase-like metal-dependent hydrolase (beta-lactamase superfamily II)